ncbi:hypothetical protein GCM10011490_24110 [Pseudoclavibacter endophyticus]|uniref:Uncharacterized protein n=1 Tax=Pseudoclavibacter endophyticus TaxID=1778590 RepID=A0A6H9WH87_9MICO|nr:hypothetical protein [Pseudoclavibacter endophyticus]KAB1648414.1 hypothetical protein F8O04_12070 [Pseudoclavibacter endophyticus]GGA72520.1 hypothetical protein GCM10011490_24110 [Pseudoclavibacter endophyticus]
MTDTGTTRIRIGASLEINGAPIGAQLGTVMSVRSAGESKIVQVELIADDVEIAIDEVPDTTFLNLQGGASLTVIDV